MHKIPAKHTDSAIVRGIKTAGIGKKGSKSLSPELAQEILAELKEGLGQPAAIGAFFAALTLKGISNDEMILEQVFESGTLGDPKRLAKALTADAPEHIQAICAEILNRKELDENTSQELGDFLLSDQPGDTARGLVASALRVRYETPDEYAGLLTSIQKTIQPQFQQAVPAGEPIVQLGEPFDGVDHSYMITPLLAQYLQTLDYRVITMVGRNSGPKFGNNVLDLVNELSLTIAAGNDDLKNKKPTCGWYFHQKDLSPAVDRWVEIRQQTIKRPFMATLEKFLNPTNADILITSAFHPPYAEKMTTVAERAGFPASIVVRNGIEGTLAFALKRPAKILCSTRKNDGQYLREEFTIDPVADFNISVAVEERLNDPALKENVRLIDSYIKNGKTNNERFDQRVSLTCAGLKKALDWIVKKQGKAS